MVGFLFFRLHLFALHASKDVGSLWVVVAFVFGNGGVIPSLGSVFWPFFFLFVSLPLV